MDNDFVIDSTNFEKYFRDCRISRPERGDVMARYSAIAEFVDGKMKQDIIHLLTNHDNKAIAATNVMRKLGCATESEAIRICKEVTEDLANGMTEKEVEEKAYRYKMEIFYYVKKEYVPENDPHWTIISITNLDKFLDSTNQLVSIKSKIIEQECSSEDKKVQEASV
jgi:hypothetical protein